MKGYLVILLLVACVTSRVSFGELVNSAKESTSMMTPVLNDLFGGDSEIQSLLSENVRES